MVGKPSKKGKKRQSLPLNMSAEKITKTDFTDLVVVGSSAGGIEALSILVAGLPKDFPGPIILAQHLDPHRPSNLQPILQRHSSLPIETVEHTTKLEPGKIYVVPANRHVIINDGTVALDQDHAERPRPSVDLLLSTAAANYGERLIAVILTGSGSDGAVGAVDVKNGGGTIVVQSPQTARYPSMPLALPPTIIDFELDIEQIGPLLGQLVRGEVMAEQTVVDTEKVLQDILEQVGRHASLDFRPYKTSTILRRINRRMAVTHNRSMQDYLLYLKSHPAEVGELVQAFLINVTQFFRDPEAFEFLRNESLPKLIAAAREREQVLRFWSAGCATGEEPYSLAMVIADLLGAELEKWSIKIFATDLDEVAINFARRGFYSENLLKGVPQEYQERFFERVDHGYRISKTLRQMVIFGQQDLSRSAPFPRMDLVICRNVLIYFTPELQDYVLTQFGFSLSAQGYLFLGKAETVRPSQNYYELVSKQWKIYRCTANSLPLTRHQSIINLTKPHSESMFRPMKMLNRRGNSEDGGDALIELNQLRRVNELLLRFLPIGVLVIDRNYRLMTANGVARRLLGLRELINEQDFLHSVRGIPYTQVRAAIDIVFRERNIATLPDIELDPATGGSGRFVSFSIAIIQMESGLPDLAAISVSDVTEQVEALRKFETAQSEQAKLMTEVSQINRRLSDVNKELTDTNEELQVSNEELMLTHEELQASIEEFETTNEELQATNEELETNNEELQATNEELQATNEELRARTNELQEAFSLFETERGRFAELVELAPFYIAVLRGSDLVVETLNSRFAQLLQGRSVVGLRLADISEFLSESPNNILDLAREVYRNDTKRTSSRLTFRWSGASLGQPFFSYTIVPSHDVDGKVVGVIIYGQEEAEADTPMS